MSIGDSSIQPGGAGRVGSVPDGQSAPAPQGSVAQGDVDAFDTALGADDKKKKEAEETTSLTPEQELREMMKKDGVKQFMASSQEHTKEVKKNFEG